MFIGTNVLTDSFTCLKGNDQVVALSQLGIFEPGLDG